MIHRFVLRDRKIHEGKYIYGLLKNIKFTEKSHMLSELKKYIFIVDKDANKFQIKRAVELIFDNISVKSVNTMNYKEQKLYFKGKIGYKKACKKAIITLKSGQIDMQEMKNV